MSNTVTSKTLTYNTYSTENNKGVYTIDLYAQTEGQVYDLSDSLQPTESEDGTKYYNYRVVDESKLESNEQWYAETSDQILAEQLQFDTNQMNALENNGVLSFLHYPNIPNGKPAIKIRTETLESFSLIENEALGQVYPISIKNSNGFIIAFPAFKYITESAVHVDKIVVRVRDSSDNYVTLYTNYSAITSATELSFSVDNQIVFRDAFKDIDANPTEFYIAPSADYSDVLTKTESDFSQTKNYLFYFIIDNLNEWFTLEVDYYDNALWQNEKLETYTLRFNQYVYDILHQFISLSLEPESNYYGFESDIAIQQYYDPDQAEEATISPTANNNLAINLIEDRDVSFIQDEFYSTDVTPDLLTSQAPQYDEDGFRYSPVYYWVVGKCPVTVTPGHIYPVGDSYNYYISKMYDKDVQYLYSTSSELDQSSIYLVLNCPSQEAESNLVQFDVRFTRSSEFSEYSLESFSVPFRVGLKLGNHTYVSSDNWLNYSADNPDSDITIINWDWRRSASIECPCEKLFNGLKFRIKTADLPQIDDGIHSYDMNLYILLTDEHGGTITTSTFNTTAWLDPLLSGSTTDPCYIYPKLNLAVKKLPYYAPNSFLNRADYKVVPLFNLYGKDLVKGTDSEPYGIYYNSGFFTGRTNIDTTTDYLENIFYNSENIFEERSSSNRGSLSNNLYYYKQISTASSHTLTNFNLNPGIYYLGGSIVSTTGSYVEVTFKDNTTSTEKSIKVYATQRLNSFRNASNQCGCPIYLPHFSSIVSISAFEYVASGKKATGCVDVVSLGLYKVNLMKSEPIQAANLLALMAESDIAIPKNGNTYFQYVIPQLCYNYYEVASPYNTPICLNKSFIYYHLPVHGYQVYTEGVWTISGTIAALSLFYYYDLESGSKNIDLKLPIDNTVVTLQYRYDADD